jgi:hypothetical protein
VQASLDAYMSTSPGSLCVSVQRAKPSIKRGQTALYVVNVWTEGGSATSAAVKLTAQPSSQKLKFTGCGSKNGIATCDLGTIDPGSANARQLQAEIQVASNASSVTSVKLTATASAKGVTVDPSAAESVSVTAATKPSSSSSSSSSTNLPPGSPTGTIPGSTAGIPVGGLPSLNGSGSTLSPGGSVSGLFPTINPTSVPNPAPSTQGNADPKGQPVADSATLPLGTPVVGAQIVGLIALALAVILAITRLSIRRRPATKQPPGK